MIGFLNAAQDMNSPPPLSGNSMVMRFPARLWRIVNSCTSGAIFWGPNGKTVRVQRHKFEREYLLGVCRPFKTCKFESFVRQLNHYGFKKVTNPIYESKEEAAIMSEYRNSLFTRDRPELIAFLHRSCRRPSKDKAVGKRQKPNLGEAPSSIQPQTTAEPTSFTSECKADNSPLLLHPFLHPNRQATSERSQDASTCPVGVQPHPNINFLNFVFPKDENKPAALASSHDQPVNGTHVENTGILFDAFHNGDIQTQRPALLSFGDKNIDPAGGMVMNRQDGSRDMILTLFQPPLPPPVPPIQSHPTLIPLQQQPPPPPQQQLKFGHGLAGNSCSLTGNAATKFERSDAFLGPAAAPSILVGMSWPHSSPAAEMSILTTQHPMPAVPSPSCPGSCLPKAWLSNSDKRAGSSNAPFLNTCEAPYSTEQEHNSMQTATETLFSFLQQPYNSAVLAPFSSAEETVLFDTLIGCQGGLKQQHEDITMTTLQQTASWDTASTDTSRLTSLVMGVDLPIIEAILSPTSQLKDAATED